MTVCLSSSFQTNSAYGCKTEIKNNFTMTNTGIEQPVIHDHLRSSMWYHSVGMVVSHGPYNRESCRSVTYPPAHLPIEFRQPISGVKNSCGYNYRYEGHDASVAVYKQPARDWLSSDVHQKCWISPTADMNFNILVSQNYPFILCEGWWVGMCTIVYSQLNRWLFYSISTCKCSGKWMFKHILTICWHSY